MSTLANAIKRRTHKERAQPAARKKFGLLEKHKDYVERAKDFHRKDKTIKALKLKAELRNPDEFYFAMQKKKTKEGVHDGRTSVQNKYSQDELRLMKTQDVKYLSLKERVETEKLKKMQQSLHLIGLQPAERKHTVFVDSAAEAAAFKAEEYFDTPAELLGRAHNRPLKSQLAEPMAFKDTPKLLKKVERRKQLAYEDVIRRGERQSKLSRAAARLAYEKEVMGKGRKRKLTPREMGVAEGEPAPQRTYKWAQERKR